MSMSLSRAKFLLERSGKKLVESSEWPTIESLRQKYGRYGSDVKDRSGLAEEGPFQKFKAICLQCLESGRLEGSGLRAKNWIKRFMDGSPRELSAIDDAIMNVYLDNEYDIDPLGRRWQSYLILGSFDQDMLLKRLAKAYSRVSPAAISEREKREEEEREREAERENNRKIVDLEIAAEEAEKERLKREDPGAYFDKYVRNTIDDPSWTGPNGNWSLD